MRIKLFVLGLACLVNFLVMANTGHAQERISGPWLWMIALTELNQGGADSTNIDSLNDASKGRTTEEQVAKNGAKAGIPSAVINGPRANFLPTETSTRSS